MVSIESLRGEEDDGGLARGAPARSTCMEAAQASCARVTTAEEETTDQTRPERRYGRAALTTEPMSAQMGPLATRHLQSVRRLWRRVSLYPLSK